MNALDQLRDQVESIVEGVMREQPPRDVEAARPSNIDRLAAEGTTYRRAFATTPRQTGSATHP